MGCHRVRSAPIVGNFGGKFIYEIDAMGTAGGLILLGLAWSSMLRLVLDSVFLDYLKCLLNVEILMEVDHLVSPYTSQ